MCLSRNMQNIGGHVRKMATKQRISQDKGITADFKYITTEDAVATYNATYDVFVGLIKEIRVFSGKKPDATLSQGKVKIINRVLADLRLALEKEPEYKFLELLDDDNLPQTSDAVLVMVQYESALAAFRHRYKRTVRNNISHYTRSVWITEQLTLEENEAFEQSFY